MLEDLPFTGTMRVVNKGVEDIAGNMMTVFFLCAGSGMLGGMVS